MVGPKIAEQNNALNHRSRTDMQELVSVCEFCQHQDVCRDIVNLCKMADKQNLNARDRCLHRKIKKRLESSIFHQGKSETACALAGSVGGPYFYRQMLQQICAQASNG
jgi:hypothetical protein